MLRACVAAFLMLASVPGHAMPTQTSVAGVGTSARLVGDDEGAVQAIIADQIQAFRRDDGETAYSFAAPSLKLDFPSPDAFMAMVRNGYQPIYRARSFSFGELRQLEGKLVQSVAIVGPDGDSWRAIYTLTRQDDGSLKITSCYLVKDVSA